MYEGEEKKLILRFQQKGDMAAFKVLYQKYYPILYDFAKWYGGDEFYRKDLIQNTFIIFYEGPDKFNPKYSLKTWLFTILRNQMVNEKKREEAFQNRHSKYRQKLESEDQEGSPDFENLNEIDNVVYKLSEVQRTAFILKYHNNLTLKEISEVSGTSLGTVKSRLHNALVNIRKHLIVSK